MKRTMLFLLLLFSPVFCAIKFSFTDNKYYTTPEDPKVDKDLYDQYMCLLNVYILELVNEGVSVDTRVDFMELYLIKLNNYTANRLLQDLREVNASSDDMSLVMPSRQINRDA